MKLISTLIFLLMTLMEVHGQSMDSISKNFNNKFIGSQYIIEYDTSYHIPTKVLYYIDYTKLESRNRYDFHDNLLNYTGDKSCYYGSTYDKGHMMSSASSISDKSNYESFDWINVIPQKYYFNRGIWKRTETFERLNSDRYTLVICGPIITSDTIRLCNILVPSTYYKIIYRSEDKASIGFILNEDDYGDLWNYAVPIDSIESIINFNINLPVNKSIININDWDW